ncbi:morgue [Bugula neritina]|uniref:E2 ubiquitin-conjugating enzyme n=1 Tax=Bugula neritina TaxID=10212 RepID=A0A7J7JHD0_BUGNE|nr:morgue [Bugula neritina]
MFSRVNSSCCFYCLNNMQLLSTPPVLEKAWKHRRLQSELKSLQKEPPEGVWATPLDKKAHFFQAVIIGPKGTPYEGGRFFLYLQVPQSYPLRPPHIQFITKILHPNVSRHGDIGLDSIHHNWSLALTLSKILLSIQSLLTDPYLKVSMEPDIAKLYSEDRNLFNQMAREWTWKYAMTEIPQVYFGHVDLERGFSPLTVRSA